MHGIRWCSRVSYTQQEPWLFEWCSCAETMRHNIDHDIVIIDFNHFPAPTLWQYNSSFPLYVCVYRVGWLKYLCIRSLHQELLRCAGIFELLAAHFCLEICDNWVVTKLMIAATCALFHISCRAIPSGISTPFWLSIRISMYDNHFAVGTLKHTFPFSQPLCLLSPALSGLLSRRAASIGGLIVSLDSFVTISRPIQQAQDQVREHRRQEE